MRPPDPRWRRACVLVALCGATAIAQTSGLAAQVVEGLPGFTPSRAAGQRALEARFLGVPSAASAAADVRELAARPHLSGTPGARHTANWLAELLRGLGFEVEIETYEPWLPHPGRVSLSIVDPGPRVLSAREPLPDRMAGLVPADAPELTSWHAYSANGIAEAEVVYANYGLPADYAELERRGVQVRGRIVLARLGRSYRGVKAEQAELHGAAGLLLFPDPSGDGFGAGDTLPDGPYRPSWSVQRGTVAYMWKHTGDPLTPGRPALPGEARLAPAEATTLPRIPVAPISYADAGHLLSGLAGTTPDGFRGALPVEYRTGPGPLRVRMEVAQETGLRPVRNVIARLRGTTSQEVIIGNHYDAWVLGGVDPHTGTAATLQIARALSSLVATGWQPRRGITVAFWDAEEYGVVGSTEWVEDHADELAANAVAYLNIDMFTAGTLDVSGSPALRDLVVSAADAVEDPLTGRSLGALWRDRQATSPGDDSSAATPRLANIGAGSDWTAFLYFVGVPSLQWTMNGRGTYGVYHSVLDDRDYYERFADSAFVHTPAVAQVMGLTALRLAEADALPFRYSRYAERIIEFITDVEAGHGIALGPERAAAERLRSQAVLFEETQAAALRRGATTELAEADAELLRVEQSFLDADGVPGRPWYRHQLFAPGTDTGYDALPLAPVVEALVSGDGAALERARAALGNALGRATRRLRRATGEGSPSASAGGP